MPDPTVHALQLQNRQQPNWVRPSEQIWPDTLTKNSTSF